MTKIFSKKELHLIIIWENGRYKEKEIIKSISEKFEFIEKYKVNWNKNLFGKNLTTFYGTNLPPNSNKEKHCGNGEFLLIIFYDNEDRIVDKQYFRVTDNLKYTQNEANYITTEVTANLNILLDSNLQADYFTIGFVKLN